MRWVVVGGGTAGCVVAGRLAERAANRVTLLEAGPGSLPPAARGPSYFDALAEPGWTHPGPWLRGRGLGGSGAVNGGVMEAGDVAQYRRWGWTDAVAALARVRVPAVPATVAELGPVDRALRAAAPDAVAARLARRDRRRVTPADAYVTTMGAGLEVRTDATVADVQLVARRAVGVRLADGESVGADRVVVTAGALGTPALLHHSGVAAHGVGEGLRNHPGLPMVLHLRPGVRVDPRSLVTGVVLRRGDVQVVALNHLGPHQPGMAMLLGVLLTSTSAGRVAADAVGQPDVAWELDLADRARLEGVARLLEGVAASPPFVELVDDAVLGEAPAGVHHWTSTCALGRVLDADGAVRGYDGLYVADASSFPELPATDTYLPTLLAAEHLVATWRG